MLKRLVIILTALGTFATGRSQQTPLYSQYLMNAFTINSAMAGYEGYTSFNLTSRQQWLGIDNAPRTFSMSIETRILKRSYIIKRRSLRENKFIPARTGRVGMGINIFSDRNGYFNQTGITMSYAYHIPFPNAQLSFGLSASLSQFKIDPSGISFRNPETRLQLIINQPTYLPDANAGVFYTNRSLYFGFSAAELLQSFAKFGNPGLQSLQINRTYYIIAGYRYTLSNRIAYEPSILIKTSGQLNPQADLSFKVYYYENYWMGISYRTVNTMIIFIGLKKKQFFIGYAFDYSFNALQQNTFGSHELSILMKFGDSARRYKWINRF